MKQPSFYGVVGIAVVLSTTPENTTAFVLRRPAAAVKPAASSSSIRRIGTRIQMNAQQQQQQPEDTNNAVQVEVVVNRTEIARMRSLSSNTAAATQNYNNRLALIQQLQGGLAKLSTIVPKPIFYAAVAVVSGLLFFEMSRFVSAFSIPVLLVLGAGQSIAERLQEVSTGPRVYETDVLNDQPAEDGGEDRIRRSMRDEAEEQRTQSDRRLNEISQRTAQAGQDLRAAISSASFLRNKISSYQEKLNNLNKE